MNALILKTLGQDLVFERTPTPAPGPGEAVVTLHAAALNHRDLYIRQGLYAGIQLPVIPGSDGSGTYRKKEVIICPSLHWGDNPDFQGKNYQIVGMPGDGTFAGFVRVPVANLHPKPAHLSWEEAAALPLAGLTAWRVLFTRCRLRAGERVLVTGIGGGVALFALQFALASGADVWVTSGSDEKIGKAVALGAKGGVNYKADGWDKTLRQTAGGFDVVVDSAGGDGFSALPGLCNPGARIGIYGGSMGKVNGLSPQIVFWKQISILGSTMGTNQEFKKMIAFVSVHKIHPVVDSVYPLENGSEAFARMESGIQFGKIVLKI